MLCTTSFKSIKLIKFNVCAQQSDPESKPVCHFDLALAAGSDPNYIAFRYRSIHHSGDMKRFPAIFLKFLCTLLPWLAELSAESAQQQTLMSRLLLHDSLVKGGLIELGGQVGLCKLGELEKFGKFYEFRNFMSTWSQKQEQ